MKVDAGSELRFQAPLDSCIHVCLDVDVAAYVISFKLPWAVEASTLILIQYFENKHLIFIF